MVRGFILLLIAGMLFSVSGCTMSDVMAVDKEQTINYEPKLNLSVEENHALRTWSRAANLAEEVGDCSTAIQYYTKVVDYFPHTEEGEKAQKRLDEISGKPVMAEEENSL